MKEKEIKELNNFIETFEKSKDNNLSKQKSFTFKMKNGAKIFIWIMVQKETVENE